MPPGRAVFFARHTRGTATDFAIIATGCCTVMTVAVSVVTAMAVVCFAAVIVDPVPFFSGCL